MGTQRMHQYKKRGKGSKCTTARKAKQQLINSVGENNDGVKQLIVCNFILEADLILPLMGY